MNNTDAPAPIATQDVAFSDVASLRNCADWAAKLDDFEYKSFQTRSEWTAFYKMAGSLV